MPKGQAKKSNSRQSDQNWGKEIQNEEYWNNRYKDDANKTDGNFEWYLNYDSIAGLLSNIVGKNGSVLEVGCGNSNLGIDMINDEFQNVTCIDFSGECIVQQLAKHEGVKKIKFLKMDATNMKGIEQETFDCVIDKATLDALLSGNLDSAKKLVMEMSRVLKNKGSNVIISNVSPSSTMGQQMLHEIIVDNLDWHDSQWTIDIHSFTGDENEDDQENDTEDNSYPHVYCLKKYLRPNTRLQIAAVALVGRRKRKRSNIAKEELDQNLKRRKNVIIKQHFH